MKTQENFYEKETVQLKASKLIERKMLHNFLKVQGYESLDDYYFMNRTDKVESWQTSSILDIDVYLEGKAVYETSDEIEELENNGYCDCLEASYFLATIPETYVKVFCDKVFELATEFELKVYYQNEEIDKENLFSTYSSYSKELSDKYCEPGSEDMRILIECNYPR